MQKLLMLICGTAALIWAGQFIALLFGYQAPAHTQGVAYVISSALCGMGALQTWKDSQGKSE